MTLLKDFSFVDRDGKIWTAPAGMVTDGASIPTFLWSAGLGPFEGKYRGPAVLHDWYCDHRTETWKAVDLMFYHAMLTAGVDRMTAQAMYIAVYAAGPRWDIQAIHNEVLSQRLQYRTDIQRRNNHGGAAFFVQPPVIRPDPPANYEERVADEVFDGNAQITKDNSITNILEHPNDNKIVTVAVPSPPSSPDITKLDAAIEKAKQGPATDDQLVALAEGVERP